jgi:hypothetical protein
MLALIAVSLRGELRSKGSAFLVVLFVFGAALILLGGARSFAVALTAITIVSGLAALTDLLSQSLVQSAVANDLRGRAMGAWLLAIGFGPVGHIQIGALAALSTVTIALMTNGVLLAILALTVMIASRQVRRL